MRGVLFLSLTVGACTKASSTFAVMDSGDMVQTADLFSPLDFASFAADASGQDLVTTSSDLAGIDISVPPDLAQRPTDLAMPPPDLVQCLALHAACTQNPGNNCCGYPHLQCLDYFAPDCPNGPVCSPICCVPLGQICTNSEECCRAPPNGTVSCATGKCVKT